MDFSIIHGDIFDMQADVLVFPANQYPMIGGSLDGQIYERAGKEKLLQLRKEYGKLNRGESCITQSCDLCTNYHWLIHTATPLYQPDNHNNSMNLLKKCYLSALELAEKKQLKSVFFVLLGAGAMKYPKSIAEQAANLSIKQYMSNHPDSIIETVKLVEYEKESQYQILIQFNQKLKELKAMLPQIKDLIDYVQIDSYIGEIWIMMANHLKIFADKETVQIKQAYNCEIARLSANENELKAEDRIYKSIVKLPEGINQMTLTERLFMQNSSSISQIINLYSKNGKPYNNAFSFLNNKLNVIKLGLGLELPFDKMCWLMWCRGYEFPVTEMDIELSEYYIKQGRSLVALEDYEEEFNNKYGNENY